MARIDAREVQMHMEPLGMFELVEQAQADCGWVSDPHALQVNISDSPKISGDRELLGKVICNWLENAAKYSAASSPIFVTAELKDGFLATSIADRGIGIDPAEQSHCVVETRACSVPNVRGPGPRPAPAVPDVLQISNPLPRHQMKRHVPHSGEQWDAGQPRLQVQKEVSEPDYGFRPRPESMLRVQRGKFSRHL